jgi:hypothetical protein
MRQEAGGTGPPSRVAAIQATRYGAVSPKRARIMRAKAEGPGTKIP